MRAIPHKLKPTSGFSHFFHLMLTVLLPALLFILVRMHFFQIALAVILLSKWRMLAVRPRYWPANIRSNAIDIIVGVSVLIFLAQSATTFWQLIWVALYGIWLVALKPGSSLLSISLQAGVGQIVGLMALFLGWGTAPSYALMLVGWLICYLAARHFFSAFDEPYTSLYAHIWGYFAAALIWALSHWLLFYGVVAQPTLLLTVIGFGLGGLYYLEQTDRLSILIRRQVVFIMIAVILVVLVFSDWTSKII